MNAVDLYLLGRRLMKLGEAALPSLDVEAMAASVRTVLFDVATHPDSSVGEITRRTGFPQSHVSASVAKLQGQGLLETTFDPGDLRRTLVRPSEDTTDQLEREAWEPIDDELAAALGIADEPRLREIIGVLESMSAGLGAYEEPDPRNDAGDGPITDADPHRPI